MKSFRQTSAVLNFFIDTSVCSRATAVFEMHVVIYGLALLRSLINIYIVGKVNQVSSNC